MIPKNISHEHILNAFQEIDKDGIPSRRDSTDYDLVFEGKKYPPKLVIEIANDLALNPPIDYYSGGIEHANKYFQQKGFVVIGKNNKSEDEFFNEYEIQFLFTHSDKKYFKESSIHKVILDLFHSSLWPKTDRWASAVIPKDFELVRHHSPLKRDFGFMKVRGYTWASFSPKGDQDKQIYFTVGVHAHNDGNTPGLVYKIDCQKDALSAEQRTKFDEFCEKYNFSWQTVGLSNINNYNWEKLIDESKKYFEKNVENYHKIVKEVWSPDIPKKKNVKSAIETKLCRICWNTNDWHSPTGIEGKATSDSHEKKFGFGHEEWLFDFDKLIDGYKYSFLEPVNKFRLKYIGEKFNLILFSFNSESKEKFLIGKINNVEVISETSSESILNVYKTKGWLDQMKNDLIKIGVDESNFTNELMNEKELFNIRFTEDDIEIYDDPISVKGKSLIKSLHYVLLNIPKEIVLDDINKTVSNFNFESGNSNSDDLANVGKKRARTSKEFDFPLKHNDLMKGFLRFLQKKYPEDIVKRECNAYGQTKVDIVRKTNNEYIFYELKTYNRLKTSMRVAIGQLLEYCYYPNVINAKQLYLVSNRKPSKDIENYILHLNSILKIPLGYIQFDLNKKEIIKEIF